MRLVIVIASFLLAGNPASAAGSLRDGADREDEPYTDNWSRVRLLTT